MAFIPYRSPPSNHIVCFQDLPRLGRLRCVPEPEVAPCRLCYRYPGAGHTRNASWPVHDLSLMLIPTMSPLSSMPLRGSASASASASPPHTPNRRRLSSPLAYSRSTAILAVAALLLPMADAHDHAVENIPDGSATSPEPMVRLLCSAPESKVCHPSTQKSNIVIFF